MDFGQSKESPKLQLTSRVQVKKDPFLLEAKSPELIEGLNLERNQVESSLY